MKKRFYLPLCIGALLLSGCQGGGGSSSVGGSSISASISDSGTQDEIAYANGVYNYSAKSYSERTKILAQLESYTLEHFLGGIPLYDSASNVLYNSRLTIPSNTYIPNFGFGVTEGYINSDMEAETVAKFKRYYHTWTSQDPSTLNSLNASGSDVSDLTSWFQDSYYSVKLTSNKQSYEWYPSLAKEDPIALNPNSEGMATKWLVKLHHNEEGYVYDIESSDSTLSAFRGRKIQLADYLNAFKLACDNNWYRASSDLASTSSGFVGVSSYLTEVGKGGTGDWSQVGIQIDEEQGGLVFEFNTAKTPFYAKYNLSSSMFAPIPQDFIDALGGADKYGISGDVDSVLSTGMYTLSHWESGSNFALRKSDIYFGRELGHFEGIHYAIYQNSKVAFQEFCNGKLDAATIPSTELTNYQSDPRKRKTLGDTVWKMQVNSCDEELWEELFGVDGTIYPHNKEDYWELKPLMSNTNFLNGLYYAVNRKEMADTLGKNPTQAFLSDAYMADPENGISYRSSEEGQAVLEDRLPETYGYDQGIAKTLFNKAVDEEVEKGTMVRGTSTNPTEIKLVVWYQDETQISDEGALMKKYWEQVFNEAVEGFKLTLDFKYTSNYMDCYYAMMYGEYDLAFGSISGNTLDPISFMDTVCSDNRSSFTLSWGTDTSKATQEIQYDGVCWSFDGLLTAANGGAVISEGESATMFSFTDLVVQAVSDTKFKINVTGYVYPTTTNVEVNIVDISYYNPATGDEVSILPDDFTINADGTWSIEVELETNAEGYGYLCFYYTTTVLGITSSVAEMDMAFYFAEDAE